MSCQALEPLRRGGGGADRPGEGQAVDIDTEVDEVGAVPGDAQCLGDAVGHAPPLHLAAGDDRHPLLACPLHVGGGVHEAVDAQLDDVAPVDRQIRR